MFKTRESYYIAIDFDGTIAEHDFPGIGKEIPEAIEVMRQLQMRGHKIILFTARGTSMNAGDEDYLQNALDWLKERGIIPWAVNHNPEQAAWTNSKKVYANYYIDDTAIGSHLNKSGCVDWYAVGVGLSFRGVL